MKVQHSDTFRHNQSKNYERRSPISMQAAGGCTCRPGAGGGRLSFISFTPGGRSLRYQGWRWMSSTVNLLAQGRPRSQTLSPADQEPRWMWFTPYLLAGAMISNHVPALHSDTAFQMHVTRCIFTAGC